MHTHTDGHTHGPCFYLQEDFNNKIDDIQETLNHLNLEQAKYDQSKEIKTKQIVRYLILNIYNSSCIHIVNFGMQLQKVMLVCCRKRTSRKREKSIMN